MPRELESSFVTSDFLRHFESAEYCFDSRKINNPGGTDIDVKTVGLPVVVNGANWEIVAAGAEATATHFLTEVRNETIAAGQVSNRKYTALARGPAVVLKNAWAVNDPAGAAYDPAALELRFGVMVPAVVVRERIGREVETLNNF